MIALLERLTLFANFGWLLKYIPFLKFLPGIGEVIAQLAKATIPFLGHVLDFFVWYVKALWEGFRDVIDNAFTVLFVVSIAALSFWYADHRADKLCNDQLYVLEQKMKKQKTPVRTINPSYKIEWPLGRELNSLWENVFK